MRIWFSGRGFHVEIPDLYGFEVSKDTPEIVKRTISKEFGILADNIYDHARLIRVGYSFNMKSKLYKTPVSWTEVHTLNYEDIKEISKNFGLRKDFELQPLYDAEPIWKSNIVTLDTPIEMKPTKNVILLSFWIDSISSDRLPPTNGATDGALAIAIPPKPHVSAIALSPISPAASSTVKPV